MNNAELRWALIIAAIFASSAQDNYFDTGRRRVEDKKESEEDRVRRGRCEQMTIEKANAKRERKAAKRRKDNK